MNNRLIKKAVVSAVVILLMVYAISSSLIATDSSDEGFTSLNNRINSMEYYNINFDMPDDIEWDVRMNFSEPGGAEDYVIFGEAVNATDGPPHDDYDSPKPPAPQEPYIRAWFYDNMNPPYNLLFYDYRSYPDTEKVWNLTVRWIDVFPPEDTTINITWDTDEFIGCEYSSVILYDDTPTQVADMLTDSYYSFFCEEGTYYSFTIECSGNQAPVADFTYEPTNPTTSDIIYFNSTSTDSDGSIVNWTWDFDDGNFGYGEQVTHQYDNDGLYDVELTVLDDDGAPDTDVQTVTVSNTPPVASFTFEPSNPYTFDVIYFNSTSTDSDGSIVNWTWDFDDGSFGYGEEVTHQYNNHASYDVELTVMDDDSATDTDVQTVTVSNNPPVAEDDTATTPEDIPVVIDVIENDYDIDGEIDPTTVDIVDDTHHGETSINPTTGEVTYTPDPDYYGSDSFTYTVDDDDGATSNEATVDITVTSVNDPPVAVDDTANTPQDTPVVIDVLANDYDIDSDIDETTVDIKDDATHGTTSVDPNNGVVTYTPDPGYYGQDSFTYDVADEEGKTSNKATVNITVGMNHEPNKPDKPSGQTRGKWGVEYDYKTSTIDPEGDQVWYNFSWGDGTYSGWVGPFASGAVASASHKWPKEGWSGNFQIKVQAKDKYDAISEWSDPLPISMPKSYIHNFFFNIFENILSKTYQVKIIIVEFINFILKLLRGEYNVMNPVGI